MRLIYNSKLRVSPKFNFDWLKFEKIQKQKFWMKKKKILWRNKFFEAKKKKKIQGIMNIINETQLESFRI